MPSRRWPRTVVATLIWFFAFVASAHAECAWVLWSGQAREQSRVWTPLETFSSKVMCEEVVKVAAADAKTAINAILKCFPDTVDPRGPKGK